MSELYNKIDELCKSKHITVTDLCRDSGASRGSLTDLKNGRKQSLSAETLTKISTYFGVSVDYLLGNEKKPSGDKAEGHSVEVLDENDHPVVLDDETRELIDSLRKKPEMKMLFSVSKGATKEDIIKAVKIIEALKDTNKGD